MNDTSEITEKKILSLDDLNTYISEQDRAINFTYISNVPQKCKDEPCALGIDEAGRGPVLGPMVYGISFCPLLYSTILKSLQCADSKALTEEKRDEIFSEICKTSDVMGWAVEVISPTNICKSMYRRSKVSLNEVSMNSAIHLIKQAISAGVNIAEIYVDTVGPPDKYQKYLSSLFPDYIITVAKKADATYPIVSAASICAKVTRDHALQMWQFSEGLDLTHKEFGSGYPGDPVTKKFLANNLDPVFGFPQLVRFSWSTSETLLQKKAYHVDWETIKEEKEIPSNNTQLTSFFKVFKKTDNDVKRVKHKFFTDRNLDIVTDF